MKAGEQLESETKLFNALKARMEKFNFYKVRNMKFLASLCLHQYYLVFHDYISSSIGYCSWDRHVYQLEYLGPGPLSKILL